MTTPTKVKQAIERVRAIVRTEGESLTGEDYREFVEELGADFDAKYDCIMDEEREREALEAENDND